MKITVFCEDMMPSLQKLGIITYKMVSWIDIPVWVYAENATISLKNIQFWPKILLFRNPKVETQ